MSHSARSLGSNYNVRDVAAEAAVESVESTDSVEITDVVEHGPGDDDSGKKKSRPSGGKAPKTASPRNGSSLKQPKRPKQGKPKTPKIPGGKI